jgi:hypothetical protein
MQLANNEKIIICTESLFLTIVIWMSLWNLFDSSIDNLKVNTKRAIYVTLLLASLTVAHVQKHMSMCSLL